MSVPSAMAPCPACDSLRVQEVERLRCADIVALYRRAGCHDVERFFAGVDWIRLDRCLDCDLRFYTPPCPGDGPFYEQLQAFPWYYKQEKQEFGLARDYVNQGDRVLEVGCGSGAFRAWLPELIEYTGLEINDEAVRAAAAKGLRVLNQTVEEHVAAGRSQYDVVCAFQVLEHIPAPRSFIRACVNALAPTGTLIFAVPSEDGYLGLAPNVFLNMPPHHAHRWSDVALRSLAEREGLNVVDVWHEPVADNHRGIRSDAMARYALAQWGVKKLKSVENRLSDRALARLLRQPAVRRLLAPRGERRFANAGFGHTVALVARRALFPAKSRI